MKQYLELLQAIKDKGTYKPPAREGMPSSLSLFGYQFRHNLQEGFPLLTTKKMYWKGVVIELLWFLRGDTNIKYLVDNGCNIWNEDAYNYYIKKCKEINQENVLNFDQFIDAVKEDILTPDNSGYTLGDCGYQYGKVWRSWEKPEVVWKSSSGDIDGFYTEIDQIAKVIKSLKETPESRRHIVTAIDPAHQDDLALYWCHAIFQFNCRPLNNWEKLSWLEKNGGIRNQKKEHQSDIPFESEWSQTTYMVDRESFEKMPKYYLDCQLYQRSADAVLGVPFNIASYALLTHIISKICNMIPGDFIHSFGDVHIYENHMDAVNEQLTRIPEKLPRLELANNLDWTDIDSMINSCIKDDFSIIGYNPQPAIKAKLSTGLK